MSKSIMIDPGHGGTDPGANGFGVLEKDWNLEISLYQYDRLKELGANVGITRTTDRSLNSTQRTNLIRNKYDYCISNHFNAFNGTARGVETIHSIQASPTFATNIANAIVSVTGLPLRRVFTRKLNNGQNYYFMHRLTGGTRTVIIEYGFMDNKADHDHYKNESNFYAAAEAVVKAVCEQIGVKYVAPGGNTPKPSEPTASRRIRTGGLNEANLTKVSNWLKDAGWYWTAAGTEGNNPKITTGGLSDATHKRFSEWLEKEGLYYQTIN